MRLIHVSLLIVMFKKLYHGRHGNKLKTQWIYRRKKARMSVRMILRMMEVARGK
jgi:hypothetical protein